MILDHSIQKNIKFNFEKGKTGPMVVRAMWYLEWKWKRTMTSRLRPVTFPLSRAFICTLGRLPGYFDT